MRLVNFVSKGSKLKGSSFLSPRMTTESKHSHTYNLENLADWHIMSTHVTQLF